MLIRSVNHTNKGKLTWIWTYVSHFLTKTPCQCTHMLAHCVFQHGQCACVIISLSRYSGNYARGIITIFDLALNTWNLYSLCVVVVESLSPITSFLLNGTGTVRGVSFNGELFFFTHYGASQVFVYNTTSFQPVQPLSFPGSIISDLATCTASNNLFVMDDQNRQMYRVDLSINAFPSTPWNLNSYPTSLSVNRAGNVLVSLMYATTVLEYTPAGVLMMNSTVLPGGIKLGQPVEKSDGTWMVTARNPSLYGILAISNNGTVLGSYGNTTGTSVGRMSNPMGLAVTKHDYLLVADTSNNRILVVDPSFTDARQLPLPVSLVHPYSLCLDETRGRLYVGEESGRLLVFDNVINVDGLFNNWNEWANSRHGAWRPIINVVSSSS